MNESSRPYTQPSSDPGGPATQTSSPDAPPQLGVVHGNSGYGHPVYDQIGDMFQAATGRKATQQEVSQWGTNVDANYMAKIRNAIYNTSEAQAYRQKQSQPQDNGSGGQTPPSSPSQPPATGSPVSGDGKIPTPTSAPSVSPVQTYTPPTSVPRPPDDRNLQGMTLNTTPLETYTPAQLAQFYAPDQSGMDAQQNALMKAILANPETLNPTVVAQMKEQQKQNALLMQRQNQQQLDQSFTARGTLGSGAAQNAFAQNNGDAINRVLGGNRDLDIQAVQTNRQDQLNALNASEALLGGQMNRATQGYNTLLSGQQAQANQGYQAFQSRVASQQDAIQRALAQFGINSQVANNRQQNYGQDLGAFFNLEDLKRGAAQTNNSSMMAYLNYLENQRQFNNQLGFNYNQLDQNGQFSMLNYLNS